MSNLLSNWYKPGSSYSSSLPAKLRVRTGKTARDRASGALARRLNNQQSRAAWQNDTTGRTQFPAHTCNGKRNKLSPKLLESLPTRVS